jgi:hypothetical protein
MRLLMRSLAPNSVSTLISTRSAVCPWLEWLVTPPRNLTLGSAVALCKAAADIVMGDAARLFELSVDVFKKEAALGLCFQRRLYICFHHGGVKAFDDGAVEVHTRGAIRGGGKLRGPLLMFHPASAYP